jgi:hypothetical protein
MSAAWVMNGQARRQPRELDRMEETYSMLPRLSPSAALSAPPTVGRALEVANRGNATTGMQRPGSRRRGRGQSEGLSKKDEEYRNTNAMRNC